MSALFTEKRVIEVRLPPRRGYVIYDAAFRSSRREGFKPYAAGDGSERQCTIWVDKGSRVTLVARPYKGYTFAGWKGAPCGDKPKCQFNANKEIRVSAKFEKK